MKLVAREEVFAIDGAFRISRGAKTEARVLVVEIEGDGCVGRGEAVPYARYGETLEHSIAEVLGAGPGAIDMLRAGVQPATLNGAAKNALTSAYLDFEARRTGVPVWTSLGLDAPAPLEIARTLSIDEPERMAERAKRTKGALLKIKLAGDGLDAERLLAIGSARRDAMLWLDANEGLDRAGFEALVPVLSGLRVRMIEQPYPEGKDEALLHRPKGFVFCADESAHAGGSLEALAQRYDAVNIKLDKTGGVHEAMRAIAIAHSLGLQVVLGCMVSSSLSIAPAMMLGGLADLCDLDGSILLASDRAGGARYVEERLEPPSGALWGGG